MAVDFKKFVEGDTLDLSKQYGVLYVNNLNALASFIKNNRDIKKLSLAVCRIYDNKIKLLIEAIKDGNITDLNLLYNNISDVGACAIAKLPNYNGLKNQDKKKKNLFPILHLLSSNLHVVLHIIKIDIHRFFVTNS